MFERAFLMPVKRLLHMFARALYDWLSQKCLKEQADTQFGWDALDALQNDVISQFRIN
jgi:hypothetical protein